MDGWQHGGDPSCGFSRWMSGGQGQDYRDVSSLQHVLLVSFRSCLACNDKDHLVSRRDKYWELRACVRVTLVLLYLRDEFLPLGLLPPTFWSKVESWIVITQKCFLMNSLLIAFMYRTFCEDTSLSSPRNTYASYLERAVQVLIIKGLVDVSGLTWVHAHEQGHNSLPWLGPWLSIPYVYIWYL